MDVMLNWLWQGAIVAVVASAALRWLAPVPARVRCGVAWASLAAVVALPLVPIVRAAAVARVPLVFRAVPPPVAVALPGAWWTADAIPLALAAGWLSLALLRFAAAAVWSVRAAAAARPFPAEREARLPAWRRVCATGRGARLALSAHVDAAAVIGLGAPVIAVAPALAAALDDAALDRVLLHEWAHVQRRDDQLNLLLAMAYALVGWHPAVWWLVRRLRLEREIACDELAVSLTGSPRAYAASLAAVAEHALTRRTASAVLGIGASGTLRQRIERLLSPSMGSGFSGTGDGVSRTGPWRHVAAGASAAPALVAVIVGGLPLVATLGPAIPAVAPVAAPLPRFEAARGPLGPSSALRAPAADPGPASATLAQPGTPSLEAQLIAPQAPVPDAGAPMVTGEAQPDDVLLAHSLTVAPPLAASPIESAAAEAAPTVWGAAADAGVAIGRGSAKAGTATAGFFTRAARSIAGSF